MESLHTHVFRKEYSEEYVREESKQGMHARQAGEFKQKNMNLMNKAQNLHHRPCVFKDLES